MKRLFTEWLMGMNFMFSGMVLVKWSQTKDAMDLLVVVGLNMVGWIIYRSLVASAPRDDDGEAQV